MKRNIYVFASIFVMSLFLSSCMVAKDKYIKKSEEADNLSKEVATLKENNKILTDENNALKENAVTPAEAGVQKLWEILASPGTSDLASPLGNQVMRRV